MTKVKSGDYFTIKYSDTVQVYGLNPEDIKILEILKIQIMVKQLRLQNMILQII